MNEQKIIQELLKHARRKDYFCTLTDRELAELLMKEIWAKMDLFTPDSDLISAVIDRLRGDE